MRGLCGLLSVSSFINIMRPMLCIISKLPWCQKKFLKVQIIKGLSQITSFSILLLVQYCFAQPLLGNEKADRGMFDVSTAASFNIKKGLEPNIFYFDILGQYSCRFAEAAVGIQITSANTDVLLKALYTPLHNLRHKIGVGTTYHFSYLYTIGSIHDLLASFEYTLTLPDAFIFFAQTGYMYQWIRASVPHSRTIVISQPSITFAVHFTGIIKKEWYLGGGISSYERFLYPVFANPSFSIDLYSRSRGAQLPQGLYFGLEGILRYSDLFTFSGYPENVVIKSVIGMEL